MSSAPVHAEYEREDLNVKASSGQLDKPAWSPRQEIDHLILTTSCQLYSFIPPCIDEEFEF